MSLYSMALSIPPTMCIKGYVRYAARDSRFESIRDLVGHSLYRDKSQVLLVQSRCHNIFSWAWLCQIIGTSRCKTGAGGQGLVMLQILKYSSCPP
jgi:hypothetical protein